MAAVKRKEKKPIKTGTSSGHITNFRQSILETFDIYGFPGRNYSTKSSLYFSPLTIFVIIFETAEWNAKK
jgi:hypothetical protein